MIITVLAYVIGYILKILAALLPTWSVYPPEILEAFSYFSAAMMKLNFMFDMFNLCAAIVFLAQFFAVFYSIKILVSLISAIRGHKIIDV